VGTGDQGLFFFLKTDPMTVYEIWADEAWTHGGELNRYWCFFGGVMGPQPDVERLETELSKVKAAYGLKGEVKWSNVGGRNLKAYRAFVDCFIHLLQNTDLRFRQVFLDRSFVRVNELGVVEAKEDLDLQFLIYYQFLKHAFGLRHLPPAPPGDTNRILARLDDHSSQKHKTALESFVKGLDPPIEVRFRDSAKSCRLQICDLLIGAAGSHGNKMHKRRQPGQRGMTDRQQPRYELAKYIYGKLRAVDAAERGSAAFNWFESTGIDGDLANRYRYKLRIWKFIPSRYHRDKGWENDHLDKQGRYVKPEIERQQPSSAPQDETF